MNKESVIDIRNTDENKSYFHFTNKDNVNSIFTYGLQPRIGKNSLGLEKSKKVFFTIGFDNTIILMDSLIKWFILKPKNNKLYRFGAKLTSKPWFPKFLSNIIFDFWVSRGIKAEKACDKLDKILADSVFLKLDLEAGVDFKYNDLDETKVKFFHCKHIKYIYTYGSDLDDLTMESWNMHTISEKGVPVNKIKQIKYNNSFSAKDVIKYMISNSNLNFAKTVPYFNLYINRCLKPANNYKKENMSFN